MPSLYHVIHRRIDQFEYWRHSHSPLSPWKARIDRVVKETQQESARYHVEAPVDRRRAYQVARMVVPNRQGDHLVDVVPDAYQDFSPPSAATFHAGRREYDPPAERLAKFRRHPQTLAYLLTPSPLCRLGVGVSEPGRIVVVAPGEEVSEDEIVSRLEEQAGGPTSGEATRSFAGVIRRLAAGIPEEAEESEAA